MKKREKYMNQHNEQYQPAPKSGLFNILGALPAIVVIGGAVLLYEAFAPPSMSLIVGLAEKVALFEVTHTKAVQETNAKYEETMQIANKRAEWIGKNYDALYQIAQQSVQVSLAMEQRLFELQANTLDGTYGVDKFATNVTSGACALGKMLNDPLLLSGCAEAKRLRNSMTQEQKEILERNRSNIPAQALKNLPTPADLGLQDHSFGADKE